MPARVFSEVSAWESVWRSANPRELYVDALEGSFDHADPCWTVYRTRAVWTGSRFEVTARTSQPALPPNADCGAGVVGPQYAVVHLPRAFDGQPVVDSATGRAHRALQVIHPAARSIVN